MSSFSLSKLNFSCVATITVSALLNSVNARGQCNNITTEFRIQSDYVHNFINNSIIGIPDDAEVEIRCHCLTPRKACPRWTYNDIENITTSRDEDDPSSPYIDNDGPRASLRINSFGEKSSGLYTCHSRDKTEYFNLTWFDLSKSIDRFIEVSITLLQSVVGYNLWVCN